MTAPELPPELAERYQPLRELGRGGMGVVVLAKDRRLERDVVIKTAIGSSSLAEELRARAQREAQALAQVRHPNLLEVYEAHIGASGSYLVMEYVRGQPLSQLPADRDWRVVFRQVAAALTALHEAGLVHRDVKPANVLEEEGGRVVLIDLGLVRDERATAITRTGVVVGTIGFMAPEVLGGAAPSPASDWFAWAVSFYSCLTREMPYGSPELIAHVTQGAPLECDLSEVPEDLREVLGRYLAADPAGRQAPPVLPMGKATRALVIEDGLSQDPVDDARENATTVVLATPETTVASAPITQESSLPEKGSTELRPWALLALVLSVFLGWELQDKQLPHRERVPQAVVRPESRDTSVEPEPRVTAQLPPASPRPPPPPSPSMVPAVPQAAAPSSVSPRIAREEAIRTHLDEALVLLEESLEARMRLAEPRWASGHQVGVFGDPLDAGTTSRLIELSRKLNSWLSSVEELEPRHLRLISLASVLGVLGYEDPNASHRLRSHWGRVTVSYARWSPPSEDRWERLMAAQGVPASWSTTSPSGGPEVFRAVRVPLPEVGPDGLILTFAAGGVPFLRVESGDVRLLLPARPGSWTLAPKLVARLGEELLVYPGPAQGAVTFQGWRIEGAEVSNSAPAPAPSAAPPSTPLPATGLPPPVEFSIVKRWSFDKALYRTLSERETILRTRPLTSFQEDHEVLCGWIARPGSRGDEALRLLALLAAMDRYDRQPGRPRNRLFDPGDCGNERLRVQERSPAQWPPRGPSKPIFAWTDPDDVAVPVVASSTYGSFEEIVRGMRLANVSAMRDADEAGWKPENSSPWKERHGSLDLGHVELPTTDRGSHWLRVRLPYRANRSGGRLQMTFLDEAPGRSRALALPLGFWPQPLEGGEAVPKARIAEVRVDPGLFLGEWVRIRLDAIRMRGTEARGYRGPAFFEVPWVDVRLELR
jgi:serine/threonine protein kinase